MHSTSNLEDGYFGSGKRLRRSITKYGKENHQVEILEFLEDRDKLIAREKEIVNLEFLKDEMVMNLSVGGEGGWVEHNIDPKNKQHRQKGAKIMNEIIKNDEEFHKRNKERRSKNLKQCHIDGKIKYDNFLGLKHSNETKEQMKKTFKEIGHQQGEKNSQFGKMWIYSLELKQNIKIFKIEPVPEGWLIGRKMKF